MGRGKSIGTGRPLNFRCAKCKILRDWQNPSDPSGLNYAKTGRTRKLTRAQAGNGGPRSLGVRFEYICLDCGQMVQAFGHEACTGEDMSVEFKMVQREVGTTLLMLMQTVNNVPLHEPEMRQLMEILVKAHDDIKAIGNEQAKATDQG